MTRNTIFGMMNIEETARKMNMAGGQIHPTSVSADAVFRYVPILWGTPPFSGGFGLGSGSSSLEGGWWINEHM